MDHLQSFAAFFSIICHVFSAIFLFEKASISRIPVGEVTLISVKNSPITSIPTNNNPLFFRVGPILSQINWSRFVSSDGT